jgi:3-(3-hydroxy-phenyl)propionate hydroxylase
MFISRPDFVVFGSCVAADLGALIAQLQDKLHHVGLSDVAKQAVAR